MRRDDEAEVELGHEIIEAIHGHPQVDDYDFTVHPPTIDPVSESPVIRAEVTIRVKPEVVDIVIVTVPL